jgi:hypothetical protein
VCELYILTTFLFSSFNELGVMVHNFDEVKYLGQALSFFCLFAKFVKCLGFSDGFCVVLLILKLRSVVCH